MPAPKKRKSQDSVNVSEDSNSKKTEKASDDSAIEELSTTERAILDEKAKVESEEKQNTELSTSDDQQPVKKRGRKPKQKEWDKKKHFTLFKSESGTLTIVRVPDL